MSTTTHFTSERLGNLHRWNLGLAVLHLGQAALILFLTSDFAIAVISWFGALVGITPWVAMGVNIVFYSDVPAAIYAVLIVQGIFFFCFGLNQWLQYKGIGRWAHYAFGEKTYLVLSLGAKSLLAWQIFAVSLAA